MDLKEIKDESKTEYYDCQCNSPEHTLRFIYIAPFKSCDGSMEEGSLFTEVYLSQYRNVFKRVWVAIKYIFGYKCCYGHWDCWLMKLEDCDRLTALLDKAREDYQKYGQPKE